MVKRSRSSESVRSRVGITWRVRKIVGRIRGASGHHRKVLVWDSTERSVTWSWGHAWDSWKQEKTILGNTSSQSHLFINTEKPVCNWDVEKTQLVFSPKNNFFSIVNSFFLPSRQDHSSSSIKCSTFHVYNHNSHTDRSWTCRGRPRVY